MHLLQSVQNGLELWHRAGAARAQRDHALAAPSPALKKHLDSVSPDAARAIAGVDSVTELQRMLRAGEVTSMTLVAAYIARCVEVAAPLGALAQLHFEEAMRMAADSDARRGAGQVNVAAQPLEGIPVSVKDEYLQAGHAATGGFASRLPAAGGTSGTTGTSGQVASADGIYVQLLRDAGAIPFVRSNVPQGLMLSESANFIWGRARNPRDPSRTPGGSSGGEGALLGARCSPLGIGTDIAGSVRIPAALCGVYGFRPGPLRMSSRGLMPLPEAGHGVAAAPGALGHCTEDCAAVMRAWLQPPLWRADPFVPPLPFDESAYRNSGHSSRPLRIGYFLSDGPDGLFPACAAAQRAVKEAVAALRAAGHTVIPWHPNNAVAAAGAEAAAAEALADVPGAGPSAHAAAPAAAAAASPAGPGIMRRWFALYWSMLGADDLRQLCSSLHGEPLHPLYWLAWLLAVLPWWLRTPTAWLCAHVLRWPRVAVWIEETGPRTLQQAYRIAEWRNAAAQAVCDSWQGAAGGAGLDCVLCPATGLPAWPHNYGVLLDISAAYTFPANVLGFPAGVVPVTHVRDDEAHYTQQQQAHAQQQQLGKQQATKTGAEAAPWYSDPITWAAHAAMRGAAGLPVAVQLLALPHREEVCLRGMAELEAALKAQKGVIAIAPAAVAAAGKPPLSQGPAVVKQSSPARSAGTGGGAGGGSSGAGGGGSPQRQASAQAQEKSDTTQHQYRQQRKRWGKGKGRARRGTGGSAPASASASASASVSSGGEEEEEGGGGGGGAAAAHQPTI